MQLFNNKQSALFFSFSHTAFCTFFSLSFLCLVFAFAQIVLRVCSTNTFGLCVPFCLGEIEEGGGCLVVERIIVFDLGRPESLVDVCLFVCLLSDHRSVRLSLLFSNLIMPVPFALEQQVAIAAVRRACTLTTAIFNKLVAGETLVKGDNSPVTGAP